MAATTAGPDYTTFGMDLAPLRVFVRYYGNQYVARLVRVTPKAIVAAWRLGNGREVERRIPISPTPSQREHGYNDLDAVTFPAPYADAVTKATTAWESLAAMTHAAGGYRPTLMGDGLQAILANTYDAWQTARRDPRRAHRRRSPEGR